MIRKTSREILREALSLANADNSDFADFFLNTTLLNNAYRDLYDIITSSTNMFVSSFTVSEDKELPDDLWSIVSVTDKSGNPIYQSSVVGHNDGGYWIENNVFKTPKGRKAEYTVLYSTLPDTLTAPGEMIQVETELPELTKINRIKYDDGEVEITEVGTTAPFLDGEISYTDGKVLYTVDGKEEDVTSMFGDILSFQVHDPYIVITDSEHRVWIYTGFSGDVEWNYHCIEGHKTRGIVYALTTDDRSGYGLLFVDDDDGKTYYAPFVPDTVLSYPNNTLFALLEYKIAYMYANMLSMPTVGFLEGMVSEATDNFYKSLGPTNNVHRMNNYRTMTRRYM